MAFCAEMDSTQCNILLYACIYQEGRYFKLFIVLPSRYNLPFPTTRLMKSFKQNPFWGIQFHSASKCWYQSPRDHVFKCKCWFRESGEGFEVYNKKQQHRTPQTTFHWPWTVETILSKKRKHEVPNGIGLRLHLDEVIMTGRTAIAEWQIQHLKLKMTLEFKGGCVLRHNS